LNVAEIVNCIRWKYWSPAYFNSHIC